MSSLSEKGTLESIVGNTAPTHLKAKRWVEVVESSTPTPLPGKGNRTERRATSTRKAQGRTIWQFVRFGLVGCLNTTIDVLVLSGMLRLLLFNTLAYACGALNSFVCNRSWTFQRTGRPTAREGARFLRVTLAAITCNDLILWVMRTVLHLAHLPPALWTNNSKVAATFGTILVSYLGMRLWVFVHSSHQHQRVFGALFQRGGKASLKDETAQAPPSRAMNANHGRSIASAHTGNR